MEKKERNEIINDIVLFAENESCIYVHLLNACALVARKKAQKNYNSKKAIPVFLRTVEIAMRRAFHCYYKNEINKWYKILTVEEREKAAEMLLESSIDLINEISKDGISARDFYTCSYEKGKEKMKKASCFYLPGGVWVPEEKYLKYKRKTQNN